MFYLFATPSQTWCAYESATVGGGLGLVDSRNGTLSTYALQTLIVSVFNAYAAVIQHPMHAMALFFHMYVCGVRG